MGWSKLDDNTGLRRLGPGIAVDCHDRSCLGDNHPRNSRKLGEGRSKVWSRPAKVLDLVTARNRSDNMLFAIARTGLNSPRCRVRLGGVSQQVLWEAECMSADR